MFFLNKKIILISLIVYGFAVMMWPGPASAIKARDKYFQAEACYKKLRNSSKKQKYRDNWLACIDKFQDVYRQNPSGPWAAAGLYMSGELYRKLYKLSHKASDIKEALDLYERVVKRFPRSRYKQKASKAIQAISKAGVSKRSSEKTLRSGNQKKVAKEATTAKNKYIKAEAAYKKLRNSSKKQKYRDNWLACIDNFQDVYRQNPSGPWASAGLYMAGNLYLELYKHSYKESDKKDGLTIYEHIVKDYPKSFYRKKALQTLDKHARTATRQSPPKKIYAQRKQGDSIARIIKQSSPDGSIKKRDPASGKSSVVTGLRFWSNPSYTRIVVDADSEMHYIHRLLKKDPSIQKPQRLYIDLDNSLLGKDIKKFIPINDNLLIDARAGQYKSDSVRVVVDIKSFKTYKIFSLKNPFRIVVDVWGRDTQTRASNGHTQIRKTEDKIASGALAKQFSLGVSRIVVDPGHGGRDYGAPGYLKGIHEKDVVLKISKRLANKIREKLKCEVFLTRKDDRFLTLEERTAFANTKNADLFISIHTNSVRDRRAYGIETFFLNLATDNDAILVAARENATSTKNISDLQTILNDLMQNAKINESSRLAGHVQMALCNNIKKKYSKIKNKGVKQAPFYVLLGAQMPAILIETSFISNPRECKRLINPNYQDRLCDSIVDGIKKYIEEINQAAYL